MQICVNGNPYCEGYRKDGTCVSTEVCKHKMTKNDKFAREYKDCNNCAWLNYTEEEQKYLSGNVAHICTLYHTRVIHGTNEVIHASYIRPCLLCEMDKFYMFRKRKE